MKTRNCPQCGKLRKIGKQISKIGETCYSCHTANWRRNTKIRSVAYKGGSCIVCGFDKYQGSMDFHHLDPSEKEFTISAKDIKFETILNELDKCVLLCKNCHSAIHSDELELTAEHLSRNPSKEEGLKMLKEVYPEFFEEPESKSLKIKTGPKKYYCDCGTEIQSASTQCMSCYAKSQEVIEWPPIEVLIAMVAKSNYSAVGRELGVSDNAVRKRIKNHSNKTPKHIHDSGIEEYTLSNNKKVFMAYTHKHKKLTW